MRNRVIAIGITAALGLTSAAFAQVGNRPDGPLVLDAGAMHYADLADAVLFTEGSGTTAAALVGRDLTLAGTADVGFEWQSALNGGAVAILTTAGKVHWPADAGVQTRTKGTILVIAKIPTGNTLNYIYTTGRTLAVADGVGQLNWLATGDDETSPTITVNHKDTDDTWGGGDVTGVDDGQWIPWIATWDAAGETKFLKLACLDPTRGTVTHTRSSAPDTGVIIRASHLEGFGMVPNSVAGANAGSVGVVIAAAFRWAEPFSDGEIASALANPWQFVETEQEEEPESPLVVDEGEVAYISPQHLTDPIDASAFFRVGKAQTSTRRGLLRMVLPELPDGQVVTSATLTLYQSNIVGAAPMEGQTIHRVADVWVDTECAWEISATSVGWTSAGAEGDYEPALARFQPRDPASIADDAWEPVTASVTALVAYSYFLGESQVSWLLRGEFESDLNLPNLAEYRSFGTAHPPTLTIHFGDPPSAGASDRRIGHSIGIGL